MTAPGSKPAGPPSFDVVLLAAGLSRRMGSLNKLLLEIDGEPLVRRSVRMYAALTERVHVVVGFEAAAVRAALHGMPYRAVVNDDYETGQPSSVSAGLNAAGARADAVIIALADQPLLTSADLLAFAAAYADSDRSRIMIPYYDGTRGNPVIVPRQIVARLIAEKRNPGCRRFIDEHPELVARYEAPNHHFTTDLDTPDDLRRLSLVAEHGT